jgi:hypothetical protein
MAADQNDAEEKATDGKEPGEPVTGDEHEQARKNVEKAARPR